MSTDIDRFQNSAQRHYVLFGDSILFFDGVDYLTCMAVCGHAFP